MDYQNTENDILQACFGIIDKEKDALSKGILSQAIRYQSQLNEYKIQLSAEECNEVTNYKREKFAELEQSKEQIYEKVKSWNNQLRGMYKIKHVYKRKETMEAISEVQNVNEKQQEEIITI